MPVELKPGVLSVRIAKLAAQLEVGAAAVLVATAAAVVEEAKSNLSRSSHDRNTPTPASPGGAPAQVSGTLADAVAATAPEPYPLGVKVLVGVLAGMMPPYGRTPASKYGYYLEVPGAGRSGVRYPWLMPAVDAVAHTAVRAAVTAVFGRWGPF